MDDICCSLPEQEVSLFPPILCNMKNHLLPFLDIHHRDTNFKKGPFQATQPFDYSWLILRYIYKCNMFKCVCGTDSYKQGFMNTVKNVKTVDSEIAERVWRHQRQMVNTRLIHHLSLFLPVNVISVDISTLESWFIRKSSTSNCD